ncbi:PEGA domain-containing protein [Candidatus Daviesbacteria bacterium]|nr:PEGA domain-containing protein [Candidatus Daviesbacteria bacterium]
MKKALFLILVFLSVLVLAVRFGTKPLTTLLASGQRAGLKVTAMPEATVFLNDKSAGKTPYEDSNLAVGNYLIKLVSEKGSWQGQVRLTAGTLTGINRELSVNLASAAGEILSLSQGSGVVVTSSPQGADITIDGKFYGKTPISVSDLAPGEHNFLLAHDNYLQRSIRASIPGQLALNLNVDLAISEADLTSVNAPTLTTSPQLIVKDTPTGFLRVRDQPSLAGTEVAKVSPGEKLILLEEMAGWDRVRLQDGKEGYVSSTYVQKSQPPK